MTFVPYTVEQLREAFRATIRSGIAGAATHAKSDYGLIAEIVANMLHGAQVSGDYIYRQIFPTLANSEYLDKKCAAHGILDQDPKPSYSTGGLWLVANPGGATDFLIEAGTRFTTTDGKIFKVEEDATIVGSATDYLNLRLLAPFQYRLYGTYYNKRVFVKDNGVSSGDCFTWLNKLDPSRLINSNNETDALISGIRSYDKYSKTIETYTDLIREGTTYDTAGIYPYTVFANYPPIKCVLVSEATGKEQNIEPGTVLRPVDSRSDQATILCIVLESSGGGDLTDSAWKLRALIGELSGRSGAGNLQYWREQTITNPYVRVDDAFVYRDLRGEGTIDIVPLGVKGYRSIGDAAVKKIQDHLDSKRNYFDDILVHPSDTTYPNLRGHEANITTIGGGSNVSDALHVQIQLQDFSGYVSASAAGKTFTLAAGSTKYKLLQSGGTLTGSWNVGDWICVTYSTELPNDSLPEANPAPLTPILIGNRRDRYKHHVSRIKGFTVNAGSSAKTGIVLETPLKYTPVIDTAGTSTTTVRSLVFPSNPVVKKVLTQIEELFDTLGPGIYPNLAKTTSHPRGETPKVWPLPGMVWKSKITEGDLREKIMAIKGIAGVKLQNPAGPDSAISPRPFKLLKPWLVIVEIVESL